MSASVANVPSEALPDFAALLLLGTTRFLKKLPTRLKAPGLDEAESSSPDVRTRAYLWRVASFSAALSYPFHCSRRFRFADSDLDPLLLAPAGGVKFHISDNAMIETMAISMTVLFIT
jgi:hypothetical protein